MAKLDVSEPDDWPEYGDFVSDLNTDWEGSGRATVLIAGAMLDTMLRRLVASFMLDAKVTETLLGSETRGGDAPLGTFSARIKIAHALGLISEKEARAANTVREIRNVFAHRLGAKLTDDSIHRRIRYLGSLFELPSPEAADMPDRELFVNAVLIMTHMIVFRLKDVRAERRQPFTE